MEKVVWETLIVPDLRQRLIEKYVPKEPLGTSHLRCEGTDPLVYKVTAFYWLLQELVGNWKIGKRLTLDQKAKLLELLVWNLSRVQQEQTAYDEYELEDNPRETVPHAVDVPLCEEEYDTTVSCETTEQIAQLVLACKEFQRQACQLTRLV